MTWLAENWHVAWGLVSGIMFAGLLIYTHRNPESTAAIALARAEYAFALTVFGAMTLGAMIMIMSAFVPGHYFSLLFEPYVFAGIFVSLFLIALAVTPRIRARFPLTRSLFTGRAPSNTTPHADARDVSAPAKAAGARAGGRER